MKAAGVSTSRYCRVPDSAEGKSFVKKIKESSLIFPAGKIKHCLWSLTRRQGVFDLSLFGIFQITRDQSFYSYTLRVAIEDIIDILKNINNESAGVSTSRYRRVPDSAERLVFCQKDQRSSLIFSKLEKSNIAFDLWQDDKGYLISRYLEFSK